MIAKLVNAFFSYTFLFHMGNLVNYLKKLKKHKIIFDVGAYKGHFGNSFASSKIFFFEPNKIFFKKLKKDKKNIYFNIGLGDKVEKKKFYIMPNASSSSFNQPTFRKNLKTFFFFDLLKSNVINQKAMIYPLDYFFKKYGLNTIDILKIDTEGYEFNVLNGISKKNFKKINYIVIEKQLDKELFKNYSFTPIRKKLIENNFKLIKKFKDPIWSYEDHVYENRYFKN